MAGSYSSIDVHTRQCGWARCFASRERRSTIFPGAARWRDCASGEGAPKIDVSESKERNRSGGHRMNWRHEKDIDVTR